MKKIFLATAIAALSISAAQAYQAEVNGDVTYKSTDVPGDRSETFGIGAKGTYYFNAVQAKNGPLAEAAFIERATNVNASYGYGQNDFLDTKDHTFKVGGEIYIPNTDFYASANISRAKEEGAKSNGGEYSAEVGLLPMTNLLVAVGVAGPYSSHHDESNPTIRAKYLTKLNNNDVNLEGHAQFGDTISKYGVSGDYYLDRTLSVGASYNLETKDHFDDQYSVGINARKFIAENISVQGGLNIGSNHAGYDDFGLNVGGTYRF